MKEDVSCIKFSAGGVYTLLLFLPKEVTVTIGKLGKHGFPRGYYTYTGSALGKGASSLKHRIIRHLRKEKRKFWHIDYLLADENVSIEAVVAAQTAEKMECNLNSYVKRLESAEVPVNGFGASDCRKRCVAHMLYFPEVEKADLLIKKLVRHLQYSAGIHSVHVVR